MVLTFINVDIIYQIFCDIRVVKLFGKMFFKENNHYFVIFENSFETETENFASQILYILLTHLINNKKNPNKSQN